MPQSSGEFTEELIRRIVNLENEIKRLATLKAMFDVQNVSEVTLNASQNNYDIANYDVLLLQASVNLNITGFSGGVRGRFLTVVKEGANTINLIHNSGSSLAANIMFSPTGGNLAIAGIGAARLFYTGSYWLITSFEL